MATAPSPSKRVALPVPPVSSESFSVRGQLARIASVGVDQDAIREAANRARAVVSLGDNGMPSTASRGRPLAATQSAPVLSFAGSPALVDPIFQTTRQINEDVFISGDLARRELQPYYQTQAGSPGSSRAGSGLFDAAGGYSTRETSMEMDGDGFDLDEVFGDGPDSQLSTRTVTAGLKRAFEPEEDEMETTDIEDEGQDTVPNEVPIGRTVAPRKGLSKTVSLPAHVFSTTDF